MVSAITKQELHDKLVEISKSARVLGAEGLVIDIQDLVERLKKDL